VSSGEYGGRQLCYDCTTQLVSNNVETLKRQRATIILSLSLTVAGLLVGLIIGLADGAGAWSLLYAAVGACFWMFIKDFGTTMLETLKSGLREGLVGAIMSFVIGIIVALARAAFHTIVKLVTYTVHLIQTASFIASDTESLRRIHDYMEYTLTRAKYRGVDLDTLMNQNSVLANNSFALAVQTQGEAQAEQNLRDIFRTINEHGEIITTFTA